MQKVWMGENGVLRCQVSVSLSSSSEVEEGILDREMNLLEY